MEIVVPDQMVTVKLPGDQSFQIDIVEAVCAIDDILTKCADDKGFKHLEMFIAWVAEAAGVGISLAHADYLFTQIGLFYKAHKKKQDAGSLHDAKSANSTESTPGT